MDYETHESVRRELDWWKIAPRIVAFVLSIGLVICAYVVINAISKAEHPLETYKGRISSATKGFNPAPEWTQQSNDVRLPRRCDAMNGYYDCVMYEGAWDTNAPYSKEAADDAVRRFGGVPNSGTMSLVTPEPDTLHFLPVKAEVDGVDFEITITNSGEGTNAVVRVTAQKPNL